MIVNENIKIELTDTEVNQIIASHLDAKGFVIKHILRHTENIDGKPEGRYSVTAERKQAAASPVRYEDRMVGATIAGAAASRPTRIDDKLTPDGQVGLLKG